MEFRDSEKFKKSKKVYFFNVQIQGALRRICQNQGVFST